MPLESAKTPGTYIGRFAPTPSGPLHFGSLVTALASFLDARANQGLWLLRIEDLDGPRNQVGATSSILRDLDTLGLHWDGQVRYQSENLRPYDAALAQLEADNWVFGCACTRKLLGPGPYPGTCRNGLAAGQAVRSLRFKVDRDPVLFQDRLRGLQRQHVASALGDFVIRRADHIFSYHLAAVVDDRRDKINCVVRGADLIDSTGPQVLLQRALAAKTPEYLHICVASNASGQKLSKQTQAEAIANKEPSTALIAALSFLAQPIPKDGARLPPAELVAFAVDNWSIDTLPTALQQPAPAPFMA